jgi:hypothetical protein
MVELVPFYLILTALILATSIIVSVIGSLFLYFKLKPLNKRPQLTMLSVPFYMWNFYLKNKDIVPATLASIFKLVLFAQTAILIAAPVLITLVLIHNPR